MTTWAQLLLDIRTDLQDTSSNPKWSDQALYVFAKDAIRDYSLYFPRRISRHPLVLSGDGYELPADFISAVDVECPKDRFLEVRRTRPGNRYFSTGQPTVYYIYGGRLYLNGAPLDGAEVLLTYDARHVVPAAPDDGTTILTIPELDEELIRLYVKAKATEQLRTQQASLDRFKPGSGKRDDNPLFQEAGAVMQEYRTKIAERMTGGTIKLWRPGRLP